MNTKIAFFDIDGTLVNVPNGMLHPTDETIRVLNEFKNQGNKIVIATARGEVPESVANIEFDGYICNDGHYIRFNNEILIDEQFDNGMVQKQLDVYAKYNRKLEQALNDMGFNPERFAETLPYFHKTLEQAFFRVMKACIIGMAKREPSHIDGRNTLQFQNRSERQSSVGQSGRGLQRHRDSPLLFQNPDWKLRCKRFRDWRLQSPGDPPACYL